MVVPMLYCRPEGAREGQALRVQRHREGQAMIEYTIVAAMLVLTASILAVCLYTFKEHGGRILNLMASEYP